MDDKVKNVLSLKNVSKSFYGRNRVFEAVNNVSLDVRENEFLVLLGPGFVFQKTAIFPWKTVMENVELPLQLAGVGKAERREKAQYLINLVGLQGFEDALPKQLSGGMKQRVGIARAYCSNPKILLMDEPFGALDAQTRYQMEEEVLRIWEKEKRTVIFVTNNIEEAVYLGDRIVLLSRCPATIKQIYDVPLPRPRDYVDPEFLAIREAIEANTDLAL